ncbi:MAG: hypothetical protein H8D23_15955 [Candidatus Brocadiales bacterium]|nr:hypothetical protein [Candidatus Brocadiales bacterium]
MSKAIFKAQFEMYFPTSQMLAENQEPSTNDLTQLIEEVEGVMKKYEKYGEAKFKLEYSPGLVEPIKWGKKEED